MTELTGPKNATWPPRARSSTSVNIFHTMTGGEWMMATMVHCRHDRLHMAFMISMESEDDSPLVGSSRYSAVGSTTSSCERTG
jgi:hypothetical protein